MTGDATADWTALRAATVIWEDEHALVVNKPPGISVMGERHDTDLVTIAADGGEQLWWVNRIDKVTSGAVVLAKNQTAHGLLTRQFAKRTVDKAYLAIVHPGGFAPRATIDLPLLTAGSGRIRVAAERGHIHFDPETQRWQVAPENLLPKKNFPSVTECETLWDDAGCSLLLAQPVTGRRHQIRVHLAWVGHAILGDPLFTRKTDPAQPRTYLHSLRIAFDPVGAGHSPRSNHSRSNGPAVEVTATPPPDFWTPLGAGDHTALLTTALQRIDT